MLFTQWKELVYCRLTLARVVFQTKIVYQAKLFESKQVVYWIYSKADIYRGTTIYTLELCITSLIHSMTKLVLRFAHFANQFSH